MARKNILNPGTAAASERRTPSASPRGAVGALQSSLSKLQENAVQELDPKLIDDAGMIDRLGMDDEADAQLRESLETYGQQVPVLVRPKEGAQGRFEIVYGRRRLRALAALGMPVKAMVRQLDDHALILAQGQENTARQDLSFIERASFCAQLDAAGYDRPTIAAALSTDLPMLSRFLKVGRAFDLDFLKVIGSAPSIGRDRWMKLADLMAKEDVRRDVVNRIYARELTGTSDNRFEQVMAWAQGTTPAKKAPAPAAQKREITTRDGAAIGRMQHNAKGLTLNIPRAKAPGFDTWLASQAESVLQELHDRWIKERSDEDDRQ